TAALARRHAGIDDPATPATAAADRLREKASGQISLGDNAAASVHADTAAVATTATAAAHAERKGAGGGSGRRRDGYGAASTTTATANALDHHAIGIQPRSEYRGVAGERGVATQTAAPGVATNRGGYRAKSPTRNLNRLTAVT